MIFPDYKLLMIDGDAVAVEPIRAALCESGYLVHAVQSGTQTLGEVAEWEPDLILADSDESARNGVDLLKELRGFFRVPMLIFSSDQRSISKVKALDAGADDYVVKPFSIQLVQARIRAHLRRQPRT